MKGNLYTNPKQTMAFHTKEPAILRAEFAITLHRNDIKTKNILKMASPLKKHITFFSASLQHETTIHSCQKGAEGVIIKNQSKTN